MKVRHFDVYTVHIEVWEICERNCDGCVNTLRMWIQEGDKCDFTEHAQRININLCNL